MPKGNQDFKAPTTVQVIGITHRGVILPKMEAVITVDGEIDLNLTVISYIMQHEDAWMVTIVITNPRTKTQEVQTVTT